MNYGDDMFHDKQASIMSRAFEYWSDAAPRLQFAKTSNLNKADFRIRLGGFRFFFNSLFNLDINFDCVF